MSVNNPESYKNLVEELGQVVVLAKVKICRWRGKFSLKTTKITVNHEEINDTTRLKPVQAQVINDLYEKKFNSLESEIRASIKKYALFIKSYVPYKTATGDTAHVEVIESDDHIVPKKFADKIRQDIYEIKVNRWDPLVEEFINDYDKVIAEFKEKHPILYTAVSHKFPKSADDLRPLFTVRYSERPLGVNADDLTREALERGAGDYFTAIRESIFRQPVEALKASVNSIIESLNKENGVVKNTMIDNALKSFEVFKSVGSIIPSEDLTGLLNEAENLLQNSTVKDLNQKELTYTSELVSTVLTKLSKAVDADDLLAKANKPRKRLIAI